MTSAFDTNVLVYAVEKSDSSRKARAMDLLARAMRGGSTILLLQTLGEFSNVLLRRQIAVRSIEQALSAWRAIFTVEPALPGDIDAALAAVRAHKLSFWDAMLWASAERLGVQHLLCEDLQDGRKLGNVRFLNPFNPANAAIVDRILPS